jgi:hypothetical protein
MKRFYSLFAFITIMLLIVVSCYYDNEERLYPSPDASCDTTNITFSGTIVTILSNNCLSCHSNITAAGSGNGIRLENFADVQARATAVAGSIKQSGSYSPMPKNGGKLKTCLITQFDIWVRNGMLNN